MRTVSVSIWLVLSLAIFSFPFSFSASSESQGQGEASESAGEGGQAMELLSDDMDDIYNEIYESLNLSEVERQLSGAGINAQLSLRSLVERLAQGDVEGAAKGFTEGLYACLVGQLATNKNLMLELVGIVMIGSIFVNLSSSFAGGFISENGFYISYLLVTSILLSSFSIALSLVGGALEKVLVAIRILVPTFMVAMRFVGHLTTAAGMYTVIMIGIWCVQAVIIRLVLPMIEFYVILSLVNNLQREDSFSKLCDLVKSIVAWTLKTVLAVVAGLNIIKGLLEPQIDALSGTAAKRLISMVPGGIASILTGTFLGAGMVVKNSIGVAGILILSGICLLPLLKMFLLLFTVKVTGAMIQPFGERRFSDGISALSQGISMLMQSLGCSVALFMLTIALMACASGKSY